MYTYAYTRLRDLNDTYRRKRIPRNVIWGLLLFSSISVLFYWGDFINFYEDVVDKQLAKSGVEIIKNNDQSKSAITRCHGEGKLAGGLPGFYVFDKVWYKSGSFYIFTDQAEEEINLPPSNSIWTGLKPVTIKPLSDLPHFRDQSLTKKSRIKCFPDQSIWANAGGGVSYEHGEKRSVHNFEKRFNWEYHHYHFLAEVILGGIASLDVVKANESMETNHRYTIGEGDAGKKDEPWLIIPWEREWKDAYGLNQPIVEGLFGDRFVDATLWNDTTSAGDWVGFENVVIVDRWASQRYNPQGIQWNKMALDIFSLLPSHTSTPISMFTPYRERFMGYMDIPILRRGKSGKSLHKIPKIVYVDRQTSARRLVPEAHDGLLAILEDLDKRRKARIVIGKLEEMGYRDQIKLFADADIILGVHGNGLTHQLWMPSGGILIEIFPTGVFLRDYQLVAQVVGHEHVAILDSHIYTREKWESEPGKLLASGPDEERDTNIHLDKEFIGDLLNDKLSSLA